MGGTTPGWRLDDTPPIVLATGSGGASWAWWMDTLGGAWIQGALINCVKQLRPRGCAGRGTPPRLEGHPHP